MFDILCVGDAVIDIFLKIDNDNPHFGLNNEKNKLEISFGEKINVEKYILDVGGNAANTAVGTSRLGLKTAIIAEIGNDEFSQKIINKLKDENINSDLIIRSQKEKTSFSVAISYKNDRTLFVEHVQREHNFNFENIQTKTVYLTSLGKEWEKAYENALSFVKNNNLTLAFNPGTLQLQEKNKLILEIIENTDYLFINKEEAELLVYEKELGINSNGENIIKKLLFGLKSMGAKNIIITDSSNGSFVYDISGKIHQFGIIPTKVIEKTGAGDSFTAGFLSAISYGLSIEDAVLWGNINSSSVISNFGAQTGLLKRGELDEKLKDTKIDIQELT